MERSGAFDYILLETTGLADPGNIAPIFWVDKALGSSIYLDGIVTVVDAKNVIRNLDDPTAEEAAQTAENDHVHDGTDPVLTTAHLQISHADIILLNKTDLVSEEKLEAVEQRLRSINGAAKLFKTTHGQVPKLEGTVLDLHAYDTFQITPDFRFKGHSHLDSSISTISLPLIAFDPQKLYLLENWFQSLLWDDGNLKPWEIHRLKGFVPLTDGTARVVQGVREIFDFVEIEHPPENQVMEGKLVIIGRHLDKINLQF